MLLCITTKSWLLKSLETKVTLTCLALKKIIEDRQSESMLNRNEAHQVDPSTVCMFTGLTDCKGREVWEGDILQDVDDDNIKYVVTFGEGAFFARKVGLYTGIPLHECVGSLGNDVITYAKVVGNKFDKEK